MFKFLDRKKIILCCDRIILCGLVMLAFILPFVFHTASLISIGLLIPFSAWIVKIIAEKGKRINITPLFFPILLWGGILLISSLNSINLKYSFHEFRGEYLKQILLFLLIVNNIKEDYKYRYLIYAILLGCFFVSIYTIFGYFSSTAVEGARATGTYGSSSRLAMYFVFIVPLVFSIFLNTPKKLLRYVSLVLFLLSSFSLILTFIRGAWIVCVVMVLILAFRKGKKTGFSISILALIMFASLLISSPYARDRISQTIDFSSGLNRILAGRITLWKNSFKMIRDYPLFGVGYGPDIFNYPARYYNLTAIADFSPPTPSSQQQPDAHNFYIQIVVETGIIGLLVFLYFLFSFFRYIFNSLNRAGKNREFLFTTVLIIFGMLFFGLVGYFYEDRNALFFWFFISLAASVVENKTRSKTCIKAWK